MGSILSALIPNDMGVVSTTFTIAQQLTSDQRAYSTFLFNQISKYYYNIPTSIRAMLEDIDFRNGHLTKIQTLFKIGGERVSHIIRFYLEQLEEVFTYFFACTTISKQHIDQLPVLI